MLKTVSSVANAIGALNYKGTWNASTNAPTLASGVGVQGDYYVVSASGTTNLDGITNWGIGDWATFNGSVWQRVEGGADGNFVNLTANSLTVNGNGVIDGDLTLQSDKDLLFLAANPNSGSPFQYGEIRFGDSHAGQYVNHAFIKSSGTYASNSTLDFHTSSNDSSPLRMKIAADGNVSIVTGNLAFASGSGIDFSATAGTGTSELLDDYEEGVFTVTTAGDATGTLSLESGSYTKIGNIVHIRMAFVVGTGFTSTKVGGLPYAVSPSSISGMTGAGIVAASWIQFSFNDDEQVSFASAPGASATFRLSFTYQTA